MSYRGWLLAAGLLVSGGPLGADKEVPIGAWFPGMIEGETTTRDGAPTATDRLVWDMRLDMVKAADFNTIHARRGRGQFADTPLQPTLDGPGPREGPEGAAAQLAAAGGVDGEQPQLLDADLFAYPIGGEVTDGDRVVRYAKEDRLPCAAVRRPPFAAHDLLLRWGAVVGSGDARAG